MPLTWFWRRVRRQTKEPSARRASSEPATLGSPAPARPKTKTDASFRGGTSPLPGPLVRAPAFPTSCPVADRFTATGRHLVSRYVPLQIRRGDPSSTLHDPGLDWLLRRATAGTRGGKTWPRFPGLATPTACCEQGGTIRTTRSPGPIPHPVSNRSCFGRGGKISVQFLV